VLIKIEFASGSTLRYSHTQHAEWSHQQHDY